MAYAALKMSLYINYLFAVTIMCQYMKLIHFNTSASLME